MKFSEAYSHHNGVDIIKDRDLFEWITDIFEVPSLEVGEGKTTLIRDHVKAELAKEGWGFDVKVDAEADLTVFAKKNELVFCLQTGNISRYVYDILKLQHLYSKKDIDGAVLAVPSKSAAKKIGSNITNFDRVLNELGIFDRTITVPILLLSFE